ncbi:MAG: hypothetical protein ACOC32_00710 [Nanoarchaeota archaeon]
MESKSKKLVKKIVGGAGAVIVVVNLILFSFQIISIETFMGVLAFFAILAFTYFKTDDKPGDDR